jgi:hypothetical protein
MRVDVLHPFMRRVRSFAALLLTRLFCTGRDLYVALRQRDPAAIYAVFKEGSPLESLLSQLLGLAFWVFLLLPTVLVPVYYLVVSLA